MGRQIIFDSVKKRGKKFLITGIIFTIVTLFFGFMTVLAKWESALIVMTVMLLAVAVAFLYFGIVYTKKPEQCFYIKNNPNILPMADYHFSHITYEDDFVTLSDKIICNKKNILMMADLEEIFLVYVHTVTTNGVKTTNELVIETKNPKARMTISIYGKNKQTKQDLFELLTHVCPNSRFGYTPENLQYLDAMRKANPV